MIFIGEPIDRREFYEFYKKHRSKKSKKITEFKFFSPAFRVLFTGIQQLILEKEAGLYLRDFGYFCIVMNPHKITRRGLKRQYRHYFPHFFCDFIPHMQNFTMDRTFSRKGIKEPLLTRAYNGQKYRFTYEAVVNIYNQQKIR